MFCWQSLLIWWLHSYPVIHHIKKFHPWTALLTVQKSCMNFISRYTSNGADTAPCFCPSHFHTGPHTEVNGELWLVLDRGLCNDRSSPPLQFPGPCVCVCETSGSSWTWLSSFISPSFIKCGPGASLDLQSLLSVMPGIPGCLPQHCLFLKSSLLSWPKIPSALTFIIYYFVNTVLLASGTDWQCSVSVFSTSHHLYYESLSLPYDIIKAEAPDWGSATWRKH